MGVSDPVAGNTSIYIDGALVVAGTDAPNISDVNGGITPELFIGANPQGPGREWEGQIDDLAIWGRALTAEEITEIFESGVSLEDLLGGGGGLAITATSFDPTIGANGQFSLTFNSRQNTVYRLVFSNDLVDWANEVDDNVVGQDGSTTVNFLHPNPGTERIFFRIEQD